MAAKEGDSVRLLVELKSFTDRLVPADMEGAVVNVYPDGSIEVEVAFRPQTRDDWGDFDQVIAADGQYEITHDGGWT